MGWLAREKEGKFVIFYMKPRREEREETYITKGEYNNYYDDYEDVIHRTGRYYKTGRWVFLDNGIEIKKENLPRKFHKLTYEDEPIEI